MKRTIAIDWKLVSQLAGWGDGGESVEDGDALALAGNAFSSMARRLSVYIEAEGDDSVILDALNCERERCEALASIFFGLVKERADEQEGSSDA